MSVKSKAEVLLSLLFAPDNGGQKAPIVGITRLEKLLFLISKEANLNCSNAESTFSFVPFRMGPWSQEVYDETDFLESLGILSKVKSGTAEAEDSAHNNEFFDSMILTKYQKNDFSNPDQTLEKFELTKKGQEVAQKVWDSLSSDERTEITRIKRSFNKMNLRQFLRYVYQKYPKYASKSEIKEYLGLKDV